MTERQAIAYLLKVLTDWKEFTKTHAKFAESIEKLLISIGEKENRSEER